MDAFIETTTIHGLPQMAGGGKMRRLVWCGICISAYVYLIQSIVIVCNEYVDPKNLKTVIRTDSVKILPNGSLIYPAFYPRVVLCVDPTSNHSEYRKV